MTIIKSRKPKDLPSTNASYEIVKSRLDLLKIRVDRLTRTEGFFRLAGYCMSLRASGLITRINIKHLPSSSKQRYLIEFKLSDSDFFEYTYNM